MLPLASEASSLIDADRFRRGSRNLEKLEALDGLRFGWRVSCRGTSSEQLRVLKEDVEVRRGSNQPYSSRLSDVISSRTNDFLNIKERA